MNVKLISSADCTSSHEETAFSDDKNTNVEKTVSFEDSKTSTAVNKTSFVECTRTGAYCGTVETENLENIGHAKSNDAFSTTTCADKKNCTVLIPFIKCIRLSITDIKKMAGQNKYSIVNRKTSVETNDSRLNAASTSDCVQIKSFQDANDILVKSSSTNSAQCPSTDVSKKSSYPNSVHCPSNDVSKKSSSPNSVHCPSNGVSKKSSILRSALSKTDKSHCNKIDVENSDGECLVNVSMEPNSIEKCNATLFQCLPQSKFQLSENNLNVKDKLKFDQVDIGQIIKSGNDDTGSEKCKDKKSTSFHKAIKIGESSNLRNKKSLRHLNSNSEKKNIGKGYQSYTSKDLHLATVAYKHGYQSCQAVADKFGIPRSSLFHYFRKIGLIQFTNRPIKKSARGFQQNVKRIVSANTCNNNYDVNVIEINQRIDHPSVHTEEPNFPITYAKSCLKNNSTEMKLETEEVNQVALQLNLKHNGTNSQKNCSKGILNVQKDSLSVTEASTPIDVEKNTLKQALVRFANFRESFIKRLQSKQSLVHLNNAMVIDESEGKFPSYLYAW